MEKEFNELLGIVDGIFESSHGSKLSEKFLKSVSIQAKEVGKYIGSTSARLSDFWSIFFGLSIRESSIDFEDFARYTDIGIVKSMSFVSDFEELTKLKVLRLDRSNDRRRRKMSDKLGSVKYFVPADIILSLTRGETSLPKRTKQNLTKYEILDIISQMIKNDFDNESLNFEDLISELDIIFDDHCENPFIKKVNSFNLPIDEKLILLVLCFEFTDSEESIDLIQLLKVLYRSIQSQLAIRKSFIANRTKLQELDLADLKAGEFKSDREICLTENGRSILFEEDVKFFAKQEKVNHKNLILASSIVEQKLFFNEREQKEIKFLSDLLQPENYNNLLSRLNGSNTKDRYLKGGISVLLHGGSGFGKTKAVYQNFSRASARNIIRVDMAECKSMWFGESQKIIKKVFTSYKRLVETTELTPILFFNEVDAIFGKRKEVGVSSVDQTENAIQNIILQELEDFIGILMATTNLTSNLDPAFERRFLYKILFDKPNCETRFMIWNDKLPVLADDEILQLSIRYEMSGGQIQNVTKKIALNQILTGIAPDFGEIQKLCESEFLERNSQRNRIGFKFGSNHNY